MTFIESPLVTDIPVAIKKRIIQLITDQANLTTTVNKMKQCTAQIPLLNNEPFAEIVEDALKHEKRKITILLDIDSLCPELPTFHLGMLTLGSHLPNLQ